MSDQPYHLGPYFCENPHHDLLHQVLGHYPLWNQSTGIALEFGVGSGASLNCIARHFPVVGFDSFEGLPEDWRPGFEAGMFAEDFDSVVENTPEHCALVRGRFQDELPIWFSHDPEVIKEVQLVHIDCDLYSSTKVVLDNIEPVIARDKPTIVFDEWHGYPGCADHEQRAWREFVERTGVQWDVIGHGHEAWGIKIK